MTRGVTSLHLQYSVSSNLANQPKSSMRPEEASIPTRASSHRLMQMSQVRGTYDVVAMPFGFASPGVILGWLLARSERVSARRRRRNAEASASGHRRRRPTHHRLTLLPFRLAAPNA